MELFNFKLLGDTIQTYCPEFLTFVSDMQLFPKQRIVLLFIWCRKNSETSENSLKNTRGGVLF